MSANLSNVLSPDSSMVGTPKSNMRPLTQAYQTAHAEHEVNILIFVYFLFCLFMFLPI